MKKAIVVGGSSGIGRELAKILSADGYTVGVMGRRAALLKELLKESGKNILIQKIDISRSDEAMPVLEKFIKKMGGVDLIVISSGTGYLNSSLEWDLENKTIMTNVTGFAAAANVAIKYFIQKKSGHLAVITSLAALRGSGVAPAYNASKSFESNYLEGLRQNVKKSGLEITITDIKPGFVKTAMAKGEGLFWAAKPEKAAMQICSAIKKKKSSVYITKRWRIIAWLLKIIPGRIYERM